MGNCHLRNEAESSISITANDFEFLKPIGRGAMGKVWVGIHKKSEIQVAIKEYNKSDIPSKEALNSILKERMILSILHHPFIININFAFQDKKKLYLGLDLKREGDLRFHMLSHKFSEPELKFLISCLLLSLSHIHENNIIHKDVKPENIILDSSGYAFLTDFGTAEKFKPDNSHETSGTPGYMSPEVICRQNHSFVSDFFAIGVIIYEVILGSRPYSGKNRKEIREDILEKQAKIPRDALPEGWSLECCDFCNKLLKRKPPNRLGYRGVQEVKAHPWLSEVNFAKLLNMELKAPFVPSKADNFDEVFVNSSRTKAPVLDAKREFDYFGYFFAPSVTVN